MAPLVVVAVAAVVMHVPIWLSEAARGGRVTHIVRPPKLGREEAMGLWVGEGVGGGKKDEFNA